MENGERSMSKEEILFLSLVSMFQAAAMQQMGKLVNPITNEVERDLEQARASIDILEMLQAKTKGNLTQMETDFLDKVLFELHMNFVDESGRGAESAAGLGEGEGVVGEEKREGKAQGEDPGKRGDRSGGTAAGAGEAAPEREG
jgi:hypothetical protein